MKKFILLCVLLSTVLFSQAQSDSVVITRLLMEDYATMGNWDIGSHVDHCTDTYLLLEHGEVWDMDTERTWYAENASRVIDRKNHFNFRYVRVSGDVAYTVYDLKSDITENGQLTTRSWLESAVFRKVNDVWKIELIHSTRLPPPN